MSVVIFLAAEDCDPPHGLDMDSAHDREKVEMLAQAFSEHGGFDMSKATLVGYPIGGRIQLLSGTHRHEAARLTGVKLPVTPWLRSDVEASWGALEQWMKIIRDIPARDLVLWTREDIEKSQTDCERVFLS